MRQDGANAVYDHDADFCGLARHSLGLRPRRIGDKRGERDRSRSFEGGEAGGGVRDALGGGAVTGCLTQAGEETEVDLAAGRVQVHRSGGEFGELCKAACDGDAGDRVTGEVFEEATGEIAHVDHGVVREAELTPFDHVTRPALFVFSDEDGIVDPALIRAAAEDWGGAVELEVLALGQGDDPDRHVVAGDALSPGMTDAVVERIVAWVRERVIAPELSGSGQDGGDGDGG